MGKLRKKFTQGASKTYITRKRALKKLQISLADFRRLCILKGIYPVEPRSRKKANRGMTTVTTFYYAKDIQLLLSEPLMNKFREHKIFLRRLKNAIGKQDLTRAKSLEKNRPQYALDHLVIERYPTFVEALRDLDDALCMVFLFATMPAKGPVNSKIIEECKRLSSEFMHFVIYTHSLRKVFLSIKGIYYQADVQGQPLTWIVPYQFNQHVPRDVDFKIMGTFLEFYRTLLGFINYRLYTSINLSYPPKIDQRMDDSAAGLGSLQIKSKEIDDLIKNLPADADNSIEVDESDEEKTAEASAKMTERLSTLGSKIKSIVAATSAETSESPSYTAVETAAMDEDDSFKPESLLFGKHVIFLSREVPRYSLEFVIRAFGGRLGWPATSGGGSPYNEEDRAITIQISDRPVLVNQYPNRLYVQPQWVYDSINARCLLDTADYLVGQKLPAHLSPFVEYAEGDYIPEAAIKMAAAAGFEGEVTSLQPEDRDEEDSEKQKTKTDDDDDDDEEEAESDADEYDDEDEQSDDAEGESTDEDEEASDEEEAVRIKAEKQYQQQILAERAGLTFSEYQQKYGNKGKATGDSGAASKNGKTKSGAPKRTKAQIDEEEREKIAISMLSKKKRKLVNRTRDEEYKRNKDINTLKARKADIQNAKKSKTRK
ncbi:mRNA-binding ribosome synthesis protein nop7 [Coemansia sp. RSA 1722]|nr:mRNA-binding ribosome synthesis protein nop7 [Coemansia sp. RSA 485]KAJ2604252.1 mRNA-binding ribosome synthesis protein nop7 [Coemansia sp. RSA 1722]